MIEGISDFINLFAVLAAEQIDSFALVKVRNNASEGSVFSGLLHLIKEHGHKFLNILLNHHIHRFPEWLVGKAEPEGNEI